MRGVCLYAVCIARACGLSDIALRCFWFRFDGLLIRPVFEVKLLWELKVKLDTSTLVVALKSIANSNIDLWSNFASVNYTIAGYWLYLQPITYP